MLATSNLIAFIASQDRTQARSFYQEKLGLRLVSEDPFACVFDANGIMLRLVGVKQHAPAPYTVLGWEVADIAATARQMTEAGVKFETFPGLEQDAGGIWTAPGGNKIAWFKDPDGNILSISQHTAE